MSLFTDSVAKVLGLGTSAEYRQVALDKFCNYAGLIHLDIQRVYKLDLSDRTALHKKQVLFCRAVQGNVNVVVIIHYDEDLGYTEGVIVDLECLTRHRSLASEYRTNSQHARNFFHFVTRELGVSETVIRPALKDVDQQSETLIVDCPSCNKKNRVPSKNGKPKLGFAKCGHCLFKWLLHTESSNSAVTGIGGEEGKKSITYKMVTIDYSGSTYRVKDKTFNSLSAAKQFVDTSRSNNSKKNDQVTARDDLSPKTSGVPITEIDTAYADRLEGESPTSVVYQLHLIHRHDFGFKVEDEHFETVEEAIRWIDGKTLRARKIVDQDRARIIEKVMDLSVRKDRRPLVEDTLIAELKELGYLIFSLPDGKFRLEFRANKVPAGDSITDLRAVLETHGWRDKNYKS